jgi:hypothetical protein
MRLYMAFTGLFICSGVISVLRGICYNKRSRKDHRSMFGLFGGKKEKKGAAAPKDPKKMTREELIAEAMANTNKAREELGEETIQKMAAALRKLDGTAAPEEMTAGERAKQEILKMDKDRVADNLRLMMDDDRDDFLK